jgi:hypothetical protein
MNAYKKEQSQNTQTTLLTNPELRNSFYQQ